MSKSYNLPALSAKEATTFKEMMQEEMLTLPEISLIHKIYPNIPYNTMINIKGNFGLVGLVDTGCGQAASNNTLTIVQKEWTPKRVKIFQKECYSDYDDTLLEPQINLNSELGDLTRTELIAQLQDYFKPAIAEAFLRWIWFNDTAAEHSDESPAGVITPGTTLGYINVFDGLFKQLYAICTTTPARRTTIAANAQVTYALQDSALTAQLAYEALVGSVYSASTITRSKPGYKLLATQELYDKALQYVSDKSLPQTFLNMENGIKQLYVLGYPVIAMPFWSNYIRAYEDNGTYYHDPHRTLFFHPDNLGIAVPKNDLLLDLNVIFDPINDYTYLKGTSVFDMKVLLDGNIQFGY